MKYGAIIVENRKLNIPEIVERHKRFLPSDWQIIHLKYDFIKTPKDYNNLFTSLEFWKYIPFDKVLIFQHDSGLLRAGIEPFLKYDYVGSPMNKEWSGGKGGNGGLSLRGREATIKLLETIPYDIKKDEGEDLYFSKNMDKFGQLAPQDICKRFSVEMFYELGALGYHQIQNFLSEDEIDDVMTQYWNK